MRLLLNRGVQINVKDGEDDKCPLYHAVGVSNEKAVEFLLKHGANENYRYKGGAPILHAAVKKNEAGIVEALLKYGASVNNENCNLQITPLYHACKSDNAEMVELLLRYGAKVTSQVKNVCPLKFVAETERLQFLELMLKNAINDLSIYEMTEVLSRAAANGNAKVVDVLMKHGLSLKSTNYKYYLMSSLHASVKKGHYDVIEILLNYGADVDACDVNSWSALHNAVKHENQRVVMLLLDKGADINFAGTAN